MSQTWAQSTPKCAYESVLAAASGPPIDAPIDPISPIGSFIDGMLFDGMLGPTGTDEFSLQ